jgi:hypothetical protein
VPNITPVIDDQEHRPAVRGEVFPLEVLHRCRNPRCRVNLPAPVSNAREAFCCRGCHASFYLNRCRACEAPIEQPARGGVRLICRKAKCKSAWRADLGFGRYHTLISAKPIQKVPVNKGAKPATDSGRASWRVVAAGAPISANQYHCATVGAEEAVAKADQINAAHWRRRAAP